MARKKVWNFSPGETRDLAVSMASELDSGASMTGETPSVSGHTKSGETYTEVATFTFANEQINTGALTTEDGETIAIGEGIAFRCTAPTTNGTYYLLSESDADDGTHPKRWDKLIVSGPGPAS